MNHPATRPRELSAFAEALVRADSSGAAVDSAVRTVETLFGASVATVYRFDRTTGAVGVRGLSGGPDDAAESVGRPPEALLKRVSESGTTVRTGELSTTTDVADREGPLRDELLAPVGSFGVLQVRSTEADAFDEDDAALLDGVAAALEAALARLDDGATTGTDRAVARTLVEDADGAVVVTDATHEVVDASEAAADLLGADRDALRGGDLAAVHDESTAAVRDHLDDVLAGEAETAAATLGRGDDAAALELASRRVEVEESAYVRTTLRERAGDRSERPAPQGGRDAAAADAAALRRLYELTLGADGFEAPVEDLLSLGCDHFGLDVGILARVEGSDYHVEAAVDPTGAVDAGTTLDLGETMCEATLARDATDPLAFAAVAETEYASHPAADDVGAYVAAPVVVEGEVYGTVNFSRERPREAPVRPGEREFVELLARSVGSGIENRRRVEELERHETIIEAVDDPVYALDTEGRFTFVNEAAKREFGYGESVLGDHVSVGMAASDVDRVREQIGSLLESDRRSAVSQFELETADGGRKTVENRLALIGDGEFRGTAGVLRDVTEREDRRRQLESFQRAIREAADGVAILDDGEYVYVDETHVDMYGFDDEEQLLGNSWRLLYDDDEVERLERAAFPTLEAEGHWRGAVTGSRPDGSTFPAELSMTLVDDGRLVCTVRDETERRQRERELELKERAMDETNVGIRITDPTRDGNPLVYVNDGFERMTGYTEAEALGRSPEFLLEDGEAEGVAELREATAAERPVTVEIEQRRPDGTSYWVQLSRTPVYDEDGRPANFIDIQQDVTERKQRERERAATVAVLERVYRLTTDPDLSFQEKVDGLLAAGREYLDLPNGFLTRIETEDRETGTQTVVGSDGPHERLQRGETCSLPESYCRRTIGSDDLTTVTNAGETGWDGDRAYETFGLETYVGGTVTVEGDLYGTLCFASRESGRRSFTETERTFVSLLRRWAGYEIERERSRTELRQQQERLDLVLSGTGTGVAEWDLRTDAVTWDETLEATFGRSPETIEEFTEVVHPDDREATREHLATMLETGEPWSGSFRVQTGDGGTAWIDTRAVPVYEDGEPVTVLATGTDVTEQREHERKRRERGRKLELVLSNTDTSVAELDLETGAVRWDGYGDNDIGSPETLPALLDTFHPDDREALQSDLEALSRTEAPVGGEYRIEDENGEYVWIAAQAVPVDDDPESTTVVAVATDITELKRREEALAESQERYRTMLRAAPDPVFVADAETGEIVEANAAAAAVRGEPRDEIVGRDQTELHPGNEERYGRAFADSVGESTVISELDDGTRPKLLTGDGGTIPVEVNADTVELPDGPVMYGVFRDVSERVERERDLELKERAMDEANVGITISDPDEPDNPLVYVNDGFTEQTGYTREEAVGSNCRFLQADDRDQAALDVLRDAIAAEEPVTVELRNYRKDGERFWNRLSVTPVYDDAGSLVNYIGIQQDVTEEKTRERQLRTLHGTTRDLLDADDFDEATALAVETLSGEFGLDLASAYLHEGDELVRTASTEAVTASQVGRVERGRTPLWEAVDAGEPVYYEDCADIADDVDRGEAATSAYFPVGDHGVVVVGSTDPDRLGERERRLVEVLTGNLAAVLDGLEREASLRASERRYRSLAENVPNGGVLTFDANLEYGLAAGELLPELGLDPSAIPGTTAGSVMPSSDVGDELVPRFRAALDGERTDRRIELGDRTVRIHVVPVDPGDESSVETRGLVLAQDVTEEARRERDLFEERERFRLLTESVDEYAFLVVDEDGAVRTWNAGAEKTFGYDAETAVGMSMAELHSATDRGSGLPKRLLQQARVAGESAHEGWYVRTDGSEFYADVRYAPLEGDDGAFRGYAMVVRDMTERRRQRRRTEQFVEESDDVVTVLDPDGEITYVSGSADRVVDHDPDDLVDENLFDYLHPDGREAVMKRFFGVVEGDADGVEAECRFRSGDDEWLNVEIQCRDTRDDDAVDGVLAYLRNVTDSKEQARRFEGIFNGTFQFTGLLDPDGRVLEANDAALEFGGFEREAIVGERFSEAPWWAHSEETSDGVRDAVARAADGEFVRYEVEARGVEGLATLDFSAKPVTDEDGAVSLVVVEGRDITERRQQRQHLEVMQRIMRHNMRNDLTKVEGYAQLLAETADPDERAAHLEVVQDVLDRWKEMSASMNEIRRVLGNRTGWESRANAATLVEDAVSSVADEFPDVTVERDTSGVDRAAIPDDVSEAVRELVENAATAATRTDGSVEVRLSRPSENWVEIDVDDDGPGLPDAEAEVLQTGEETALSHGDSLGLWMVRAVVKQVGGDVAVDTTGNGTSITLRVPAEDAPQGDAAGPAEN